MGPEHRHECPKVVDDLKMTVNLGLSGLHLVGPANRPRSDRPLIRLISVEDRDVERRNPTW